MILDLNQIYLAFSSCKLLTSDRVGAFVLLAAVTSSPDTSSTRFNTGSEATEPDTSLLLLRLL